MKCPACKMETPEELGYCDFCKEPFRRKAPEPKPAAEKVEVPAAVMAKLLEAKLPAAGELGDSGGIPPEFASLDTGEKIPQLPPVARKLAWAFLGIIAFWTVVGLIVVMYRARHTPLPAQRIIRPPMMPDAPPPAPDAPEAAPEDAPEVPRVPPIFPVNAPPF